MHRCYCTEYCLPAGGNDFNGRPLGVAFPKKHFLQSHQLRVQHERDARQRADAQAAQRTQDRELEVAGAQLFATTLLDNPPVDNQNTHSNESRSNPASMPSINDGSVQAIVDGIQNIGLSPESSVEEQFHRLSLETPVSNTQRTPPPSNSQIPISTRPPAQTRSKEE